MVYANNSKLNITISSISSKLQVLLVQDGLYYFILKFQSNLTVFLIVIFSVCLYAHVFFCASVCICGTWDSGGLVWLAGLCVLEGTESRSVPLER